MFPLDECRENIERIHQLHAKLYEQIEAEPALSRSVVVHTPDDEFVIVSSMPALLRFALSFDAIGVTAKDFYADHVHGSFAEFYHAHPECFAFEDDGLDVLEGWIVEEVPDDVPVAEWLRSHRVGGDAE